MKNSRYYSFRESHLKSEKIIIIWIWKNSKTLCLMTLNLKFLWHTLRHPSVFNYIKSTNFQKIIMDSKRSSYLLKNILKTSLRWTWKNQIQFQMTWKFSFSKFYFSISLSTGRMTTKSKERKDNKKNLRIIPLL